MNISSLILYLMFHYVRVGKLSPPYIINHYDYFVMQELYLSKNGLTSWDQRRFVNNVKLRDDDKL